MNVFISWSSERSRAVAEALRDWLPTVIQAVKPWISAKDIEKGTRWRVELAEQLDDTNAGIVCVTKDNQHAPWLLFEAGAISKSVDQSFVWTYLLDLSPTDVKEPLSQFQHTEATEDDTRQLVKTINGALGERALSEHVLKDAFDTYWPRLEEKLKGIPEPKGTIEPPREDRDMLEEILNTVRGISRTISTGSTSEGGLLSQLALAGIEMQRREIKRSAAVNALLKGVKNKALVAGLDAVLEKEGEISSIVNDSGGVED